MQKIIESTRLHLSPFIGDDDKASQTPYAKYDSYARLVRKVPKQNYERLPKMVPISWL